MAVTTPKFPFLVWMFLVSATLLTGWIADHHNLAGDYTVAVVLIVAFVKARTVVLHYMELKKAPFAWRMAFEMWTWLTPAIIFSFWYLSS